MAQYVCKYCYDEYNEEEKKLYDFAFYGYHTCGNKVKSESYCTNDPPSNIDEWESDHGHPYNGSWHDREVCPIHGELGSKIMCQDCETYIADYKLKK